MRILFNSHFSISFSSLKLSSALSKFSMISSASSSAGGRLSKSARLLSFIQKRSRLSLSLCRISSMENLRKRPSGFSADQVSVLLKRFSGL